MHNFFVLLFWRKRNCCEFFFFLLNLLCCNFCTFPFKLSYLSINLRILCQPFLCHALSATWVMWYGQNIKGSCLKGQHIKCLRSYSRYSSEEALLNRCEIYRVYQTTRVRLLEIFIRRFHQNDKFNLFILFNTQSPLVLFWSTAVTYLLSLLNEKGFRLY